MEIETLAWSFLAFQVIQVLASCCPAIPPTLLNPEKDLQRWKLEQNCSTGDSWTWARKGRTIGGTLTCQTKRRLVSSLVSMTRLITVFFSFWFRGNWSLDFFWGNDRWMRAWGVVARGRLQVARRQAKRLRGRKGQIFSEAKKVRWVVVVLRVDLEAPENGGPCAGAQVAPPLARAWSCEPFTSNFDFHQLILLF